MKIAKQTIFEILSHVKDYLFSAKYKTINDSYVIAKYLIEDRLSIAYARLNEYELDDVPLEVKYSPINLRKQWEQFDKCYIGDITPEIICEYRALINKTLDFLEAIILLPKVHITNRSKVSQSVDVEDETSKMRRIMANRQALNSELEKLRKKTPLDTEKIKEIERQLNQLNNEYKEIQATKSKAESDSIIEKNIANKISECFEELKGYAKFIEDEKDKIKLEYRISLWGIPILIVLFFILYGVFLYFYNVDSASFNSWVSFLPYSVMIPVFVAIMWLFVYLKDRANKISIELSTRLFNIHYLEGLLKLTNSVSPSNEDSWKKLDKATDSLMTSYLEQVKYNHITIKEVAKLEKNELESIPYLKLLQKFESVIKLMRQ